jgi:fructokinase
VKENKSCFGVGLVALDVILVDNDSEVQCFYAGGTCGNVLSILSFLGWNSFPIARLSKTKATETLLSDLSQCGVAQKFLFVSNDGSTPIIIHRIGVDKSGHPTHRFEFKDPITRSWLPQYKSITKAQASTIIDSNEVPDVFFVDRMSPGTYDLVSYYKSRGVVIYFEPSNDSDKKLFQRFLQLADIVKFSSDRINDYKERYPESQCFLEIQTLGKDGLEFRTRSSKSPSEWKRLPAYSVSPIKDAAGSGDWCSAGVITTLFSDNSASISNINEERIVDGLRFGQKLASLNCLFNGARGLMYNLEYERLKNVLNAIDSKEDDISNAISLIFDDGYICEKGQVTQISALYAVS